MKTLTGLPALKHILDPVHGMIPITEIELKLISTPIFQRLRNISQLGIASFVYPGATHNRFLHSLGTMHIIDKMLNTLKQENKFEYSEQEWLSSIKIMRLAALLHDCGHLPFSHIFEKYNTDKNHEFNGQKIIERSDIARVLRENSVDPNSIASIITGNPDTYSLVKLMPLIHSDADADRMDYLLRDAYFTGVPFGKIDLDRICGFVTTHKEKICFYEKTQDALEDTLFSRYQMYKAVYSHKTVLCFDLILRKIYSIFEKYQNSIPIPFNLPASEEFEQKPKEWFEGDFCKITEGSFFTSISILLENEKNLEIEDRTTLIELDKRIRTRNAIKKCYRKDDLSPVTKTEYCEKEKQLFEVLKLKHTEIVNDWSFLRHDPAKPIQIATPITVDFDDDQDFSHIRILKETRPNFFELRLLQELTGSFIREVSTHHRVLIVYYQKNPQAQKIISSLAEEYFAKI